MKGQLLLTLPLLASASVVSLQRRQGHSHGGDNPFSVSSILGSMLGMVGNIPPAMMAMSGDFMALMMSPKSAMKIEEMKPILRPDAKRIRLTYGPYKLKGLAKDKQGGNTFSFDPNGTGWWHKVTQEFPRNITILDAFSKLVDDKFEDADVAGGLYNHHIAFFTMNKSPIKYLSCGNRPANAGIPVSIFMGGATESLRWRFTSEDGKFNSGFYLDPKANVINMIDIVNYHDDPRMVYTVSEMEYVPGQVDGALDATQDLLNIGICSGGNGMDVKTNGQKRFSFGGGEIEISENGYFVNARGHLHDGGVNMEVMINGKEVCNSKAIYGGPGHESKTPAGAVWKTLASTTACEQPIKVRKGDKLKIKANYDLEAHPPRPHAEGEGMAEEMGLLLVTFAKDA